MVHYNLYFHSYNPASLGFRRLPIAISLFYGARLDALSGYHTFYLAAIRSIIVTTPRIEEFRTIDSKSTKSTKSTLF